MLFADTDRFLLSDSPRCDSMLVLWNMDFISHVTVCALQVRLLILTGFCAVRDHCVTICCALGYGLYISHVRESVLCGFACSVLPYADSFVAL